MPKRSSASPASPSPPPSRGATARAAAGGHAHGGRYAHPHERPEAGWRERLAAWRHRVFPDRQLILRSEAGVHAIRLSSGLQQTVAGGLLVALAWSAGAGVALYWQSARIDGTAQRLAAAERSYADLMAQVDAARSKMVELAGKLDDAAPTQVIDPTPVAAGGATTPLPQELGRLSAALDALAERNGRLNDRLSEQAEVVAALKHANATLRSERARVEKDLAQARQALSDARLSRSDLHARVGVLREELRAARAHRQASQQGRLNAERRASDLADSLAATRDKLTAISARAQTLEIELEQTEAKRQDLLAERQQLAGKVGRLEEALGRSADRPGAGAQGGSLGERIAGLENALLAAERRGDDLAQVRDALMAEIGDLHDRIEQLRKRQSGLVAELTERTGPGLKAMEKTIAMTGMDVDALVARVQADRSGRGGPFVPASLQLPGPSVAADQLARLDRQTRRLAALQTAMGAMPLSAPVESYWISSFFGKRKDPYNGRWAMHEGIDLAATAGSPVLATAPGRVKFAGRKSGYGRIVILDHGFGMTTHYGHLRSISVEQGARVANREQIGALGSSGRSTGPHVHYEVRVAGKPLDPQNFLKAGRHVFKD
jgi:murein DD-endopeptidase MepM/ murein hydrolase activator NlpD